MAKTKKGFLFFVIGLLIFGFSNYAFLNLNIGILYTLALNMVGVVFMVIGVYILKHSLLKSIWTG